MIRSKILIGVLALLILPLMGCVMCSQSLDADYTARGGAWERHNPTSGRVGSAFSDAGAPASHVSAEENGASSVSPPDASYYEAARGPLLETPR